MGIRRAAARLHKGCRCLKKLLLGDDHMRRSFVKQYGLVAKGLKVPELGLGTGRTIRLEDPLWAPQHSFREVSVPSFGFGFDKEELVPGANFVDLVVELSHLVVALKGADCAVE